MSSVEAKSFDAPDEVRRPEKTSVEIVRLTGATVARFTFQPGWKWSECIKPAVGTDSCQVRHVGAVISGHLRVVHEDGSTADLGPGDAYVISPGHDGWVTGDEAVVMLEFESAETYAAQP